MNKYYYDVPKGKSINSMQLSNFQMSKYDSELATFEQPVNLEEGYIQIVYPQRKQYIKTIKEEEFQAKEYKNLYTPFENNKIEFSSFINTTHLLRIEGEFFIESDEDTTIDLELITCGVVQIFVNEMSQVFYAPMTRNVPSKNNISLTLKKGINKVNIFAREMAERDVFFYFELKNIAEKPLKCFVEINEDVKKYTNVMDILYSFCLNIDEFEIDDKLILNYNNTLLNDDIAVSIRPASSLINPVHTNFEFGKEFILRKDVNQLEICNIDEFPIGVYFLSFEIETLDGPIKREILISNHAKTPSELNSYDERKNYIMEDLAKNSPNNITKSLLLASQEKVDEVFEDSFMNGINFIQSKGDCADFQTVPLLWLMYKYRNTIGEKYFEIAKDTMLNFRYWIDEPGNDAMWYFSENHAFLFHISQYLAGHLFKSETFNVSNNDGEIQYKKGYDRLIHWFEVFNEFEFAEWNSTTYFPVDFIGLLALYECAPDDDIKNLAKQALDRIHEIIEANLHHNLMGTTYGRVYEKELKGLKNGELCLITWLNFGRGFYNLTNRASVLVTLSDYRYSPKNTYTLENNEKYEIAYAQGYNKVITYIHKEKDFQMCTAINYKYKLKGHQQHIMNISFSTDEIQLWINNPGERVFSGESRPSFWAGNGINPQVFAKNNIQLYNYDNRNSVVEFTHMYFPIHKFEKYKIENKMLFAENKGAYIAVISTSELFQNQESVVKNREVRFKDITGSIAVVCSSNKEYSTLEEFMDTFKASEIWLDNESSYFEYDNNKYLVTNNQFYINGEFINYEKLI